MGLLRHEGEIVVGGNERGEPRLGHHQDNSFLRLGTACCALRGFFCRTRRNRGSDTSFCLCVVLNWAVILAPCEFGVE